LVNFTLFSLGTSNKQEKKKKEKKKNNKASKASELHSFSPLPQQQPTSHQLTS
jgi:hypothetical protein